MLSLMQKLSTLWCLKGVSYSLNVEGSKVSLKITYNGKVMFCDDSNSQGFKENAIFAINNLFDEIY
ncbi:hypothetical protein [Shigella phage ESh22]|nr:hypothetical protein [Shigella phage ESh22]